MVEGEDKRFFFTQHEGERRMQEGKKERKRQTDRHGPRNSLENKSQPTTQLGVISSNPRLGLDSSQARPNPRTSHRQQKFFRSKVKRRSCTGTEQSQVRPSPTTHTASHVQGTYRRTNNKKHREKKNPNSPPLAKRQQTQLHIRNSTRSRR
jgi:hypothetical protein